MRLIRHAVIAYRFHLFIPRPAQHFWLLLLGPIYSLTIYYGCSHRALTLSALIGVVKLFKGLIF